MLPAYITRNRDCRLNTIYIPTAISRYSLISHVIVARRRVIRPTHKNGNMRIELKFNKPMPEAITCQLYLELENSVLIDFARTVKTEF